MPTLCLMCIAMLVRALYLWVSIQQDEEDTNTHTDKKNDKQTDNDKSDSEVPGDEEAETVLRKQNVKKTVNDDKEDEEDTNNLTQKRNDDLSDSEVPGDEETETVLRKRNVKKIGNVSYVPDDRERSVKTAEDKLAVTKVPGDKKLKYRMSVFNIGANYSLVHLIGYAMMNTPKLFTYVGECCSWSPSPYVRSMTDGLMIIYHLILVKILGEVYKNVKINDYFVKSYELSHNY